MASSTDQSLSSIKRKSYKRVDQRSPDEAISWFETIFLFWTYAVGMIVGYYYEYLNKLRRGSDRHDSGVSKGYAPLYEQNEYFFIRRLYGRLRDCWDRPITNCPGRYIDVLNRQGVNMNEYFLYSGETKRALNMGSYNYLGFAENSGPLIDHMVSTVRQYGVSSGSVGVEAGTSATQRELERLIAQHVGKEDAVICGMGYLTNSGAFQAFIQKNDLVISDTLNHASIVAGCRITGAKVLTFVHNDPEDLEKVVRNAIAYGRPRTRRPYGKIVIIVEGIYSMEGDILRLPEIVEIKKRYGCYLYVDEAHSIGALGKNGRGVCEQTGVDPRDVDFLMGTFTKSFASVGGYIASDKRNVDFLRVSMFSQFYSVSMPAPCIDYALSALKVIMGLDGTQDGRHRLDRLFENTRYFRARLRELGFAVMGQDDSPVVPVILYNPNKMVFFSRYCFSHGIAIVVVGYPATNLVGNRCRFCMSSAFSKEDLDKALDTISNIGDLMNIKFGNILVADDSEQDASTSASAPAAITQ